jgi:hypothetical protein
MVSCGIYKSITMTTGSKAMVLVSPVTVAEWSKTSTVFARADAGTVGSNPT